ncbi:MAG: RecX family transcriptional regulator [Flavobacteriaceae bacterium]|nr:RecX family transcriptional regulator [Flavobacteriaceae bacterium]
MHNTHTTYTIEEAKRRVERYCVYQERCHLEIERKLREMRMIPIAVDEIIAHLIQHDFLNETRFAQAFARGKFSTKKWGKQRIVRELKQRHISAYNIKIALKEISDSDYTSTFYALAEKRWTQLTSEKNLQKKKKKFVDYMRYRGWESQKIWDVLADLQE